MRPRLWLMVRDPWPDCQEMQHSYFLPVSPLPCSFGALVVGWVAGSFLVPFLPRLPFTFWSLELGTALITYAFLWVATTFLK